jgi:4-hydroxy-3-methylbut-2-enyl diphosphate reductase
VDDEAAIDLQWLAHARTIGLTAGASAPESLVQRVLSVLCALGPTEVSERPTTRETVRFKLPSPTVKRDD